MTDAAPTTSHRRRASFAIAGGLLAGVGALALATWSSDDPTPVRLAGVTEDVRGNCDEAEHAGDPECAGLQAGGARVDDDATTSTTAGATTAPDGSAQPGDVRVVQAGDAGSVTVVSDGASLGVLTTSPNPGWRVEVEQAAGREIEVTFRSGSLRIDAHVELEDGQIRERVRTRDDATGAETRTEDGAVVRVETSVDASSSGHGSDDDATADDSSGPSSGDDDSSGSGSDDDSSQDSGDDSSSSGSGSDDGPGHD